ncbi:MAG: GNAT family N-acetyltransferase [Anaerolineaceae bacterium]|nr:GNAT family N-acetyltransferase [Anaerolineaceae bacterium]
MTQNTDFILSAEKTYKENPQKFGFAFWKHRELLKSADLFEEVISGCIHMYAINKNRLVYYWSEDNRMVISKDRLAGFDLSYLHSKYIDSITGLTDTHNISDGNALIYNKNFKETKINKCYYADSFNFNNTDDYIETADIINNSTFGGGNMTTEKIKGFTKLPVFDGNLWVFVKEKETGKPVGIGISIYDKDIRETELEWIYVQSDHHGKGVGRILIQETVHRAKDKSDIIRVGGVADDFYIKCGFETKTDQWLWVKRKDSNIGWWD